MQEKLNKNAEISARISKLIKKLGVTANSFAVALGYKRAQTIYDVVKGKSAPSFDFFNKLAMSEYSDIINMDWLLTGRGEILQTKSTENVINSNDTNFDNVFDTKRKVQKTLSNTRTSFPKTPASIKDENGNESILITQRFPLRTDHPVELQRIPLYDFDATAGMVGLFSENNMQYPINYLSIPDLPHVDGAIFVRGDSMYPLLKSGDIVVYKAVNSLSNIMWGEMYIVDCDLDGDDYTAVKFLNKVDGDDSQALLVSHNSHHAPKAIPLSAIRALAIVKASIRYNVMG